MRFKFKLLVRSESVTESKLCEAAHNTTTYNPKEIGSDPFLSLSLLSKTLLPVAPDFLSSFEFRI